MKRILCLLSTTAIAVLTSTAVHAADLAAKAYMLPPPLPAPSWTGFYLGINGGFGGDKNKYPFSVGGVSGTSSLNSSGFFGGGQIGYNWQFAPAWVAGVETDIDDADIQGMASTTALGASGSIGTRLDWFGTVRGRVGYLVTPNALLYGTGGFAYGHTTSTANATAAGLVAGTSVGKDMNGWTAGAGLEYALTQWLTFKTEYLFVDLGSANLASGVAAGVPFSLNEKTTVHTVKAGINVKLGSWGGGWGL
ncbi:MAG TPA: outer membrane beta-barrel protein [Xanthobacteraceae bacterium]|jgi:outer membrane immunogenic protein|nr:outer membrane beta-barrel protein [Xanthobacteraceae bacterium]